MHTITSLLTTGALPMLAIIATWPITIEKNKTPKQKTIYWLQLMGTTIICTLLCGYITKSALFIIKLMMAIL